VKRGRNNDTEALPMLLRSFKLPAFAREYAAVAERARGEKLGHEQYLMALSEIEADERSGRRIRRLLEESKLPRGKTLGTYDLARLPAKTRASFSALQGGGFLDRAENVIAFGNPGTGKTHLLAALAHELVRQGRTVLFAPAYQIVQRLLAAKRDLRIDQELRKLDRFEALVLDDIGYVQQNREEMEVLFTLLAERYERRSVLITSNLVFSKWDQIFKDAMTTAAAIDRVVHHSVILEMGSESFRARAARERSRSRADQE
jgi:DNA replication protein DnaC